MAGHIVVITGASSGIGREFALQTDQIMGDNIREFWLIARSREALQKTADAMKHSARLFALDLSIECDRRTFAQALFKEHASICMLINCAGFGLLGSFAGQSSDDINGMIRLNCEALTHMTHLCLPYMCKNARIIQVASSAAFLPQPGFAVYAASKSYVEHFSRALCAELRPRNIYVTCVCPGPVDTPFFQRADKNGQTMAIKKLAMIKPRQVVYRALKASYAKKSMSVSSVPMKGLQLISKLLPHEWIIKLLSMKSYT